MSYETQDFAPQFERDVAKHRMTVEHDDGVFRSVHFGEPGTGVYSFRLTTWPGHICISGDMGCYVLSRLPDMFEFCRASDDGGPGLYRISIGYWAEKLQATDKSGKPERFSAERFEERIREALDEWIAEHEPDNGDRRQLEDELRDLVSLAVCDGEVPARDALSRWNAPDTDRPLFSDTWEWSFDEWDTRWLWCCCAIQWGIREYDRAKATQAPAGEVAGA